MKMRASRCLHFTSELTYSQQVSTAQSLSFIFPKQGIKRRSKCVNRLCWTLVPDHVCSLCVLLLTPYSACSYTPPGRQGQPDNQKPLITSVQLSLLMVTCTVELSYHLQPCQGSVHRGRVQSPAQLHTSLPQCAVHCSTCSNDVDCILGHISVMHSSLDCFPKDGSLSLIRRKRTCALAIAHMQISNRASSSTSLCWGIMCTDC